ncbi:hypothetical protein TNCT_706851 [Trichonephila clavata]|uniref:Secreted protein n=1 Tax=Trichonephila clavata TaxID=2740835 RepID=A0A8X6FDW6_TRICU|nr:hypothetical protein TNCT_706851 [Trichonephila clavata]
MRSSLCLCSWLKVASVFVGQGRVNSPPRYGPLTNAALGSKWHSSGVLFEDPCRWSLLIADLLRWHVLQVG